MSQVLTTQCDVCGLVHVGDPTRRPFAPMERVSLSLGVQPIIDFHVCTAPRDSEDCRSECVHELERAIRQFLSTHAKVNP